MHNLFVETKMLKELIFDENKISKGELVDRYLNGTLSYDEDDGFIECKFEEELEQAIETVEIDNTPVYENYFKVINKEYANNNGIHLFKIITISNTLRKFYITLVYDYGYKQAIDTFICKTEFPQNLITKIELVEYDGNREEDFVEYFNNKSKEINN